MTTNDFIIVIDTDSYAGAFEREMTAWISGHYGECRVGSGLAAAAREVIDPALLAWFDVHIVNRADESDCRRPAEIWQSPDGSEFNSVAIFVDAPPSAEQLDVMVQRAIEFTSEYHSTGRLAASPMAEFHPNGPWFKVTGARLLRQEAVVHPVGNGWTPDLSRAAQ